MTHRARQEHLAPGFAWGLFCDDSQMARDSCTLGIEMGHILHCDVCGAQISGTPIGVPRDGVVCSSSCQWGWFGKINKDNLILHHEKTAANFAKISTNKTKTWDTPSQQ